MRCSHFGCTVLFTTLLLMSAGSARAADTVEPFDIGMTDFEFYVGIDGLGTTDDKTLYGDLFLGYGLTESLSGFVGITLEGNHHFAGGAAALSIGGYGNVLDTDYIDLDLFLTLSVGGDGFSEFSGGPAMEFNVDLDKDMNSLGFYLRAGFTLSGAELAPANPSDPDAEPRFDTTYNIDTTLGAYYMIADGHQLLLEFDMLFDPDPAADVRGVDVGGIALGYNVAVHDAGEMINQVYLDIPQSGERAALNLMTGILVTLPTAAK